MAGLTVLFEHAAGYAMFTVKEFEEIGMLLQQVEESVTDLKKFNQIVQLTAFLPFKNAVTALDNINSISEGLVTEELQLFLEKHLSKKRSKVTLGVAEPKLAAALSESLGCNCLCTGSVPEILRGVRMHFANLVKGFTNKSSGIAQLGLGHSYSRAKVKFNVNRVDNMIIQSIALLDQLDKDVNTFSMRIREWYSYHFPELYKIVPENYLYAKAAKLIGDRKSLTEQSVDALEEAIMDRTKAEAIIEAAKSSMGMDISAIDLANIEMFAGRVVGLSNYRTELGHYLHCKMSGVAPNLSALIGDQVGARLISHAGSLTNLAKFPASTVQILGAEKALFRALKTRSNTPKYGLLFNSSFISRADTKDKGRISRYLANKCSIASRIDCFSDTVSSIFGEMLKEQVEDRLTFYKTGDIPRKNLDVMKQALVMQQQQVKEMKKKKKKAKKRKHSENGVPADALSNGLEMVEETNELAETGENMPKMKKKKKKNKEVVGEAE